MLTFNNTNIFTGFLKQILATFNLPAYHVYSLENRWYNNWALQQRKEMLAANTPTALIPPLEQNIFSSFNGNNSDTTDIRELYIKDDIIQYYLDNNWTPLPDNYIFDQKQLNNSKHLVVKDNVYDSYTHEYLGEFLRFFRDYYNFNLMSLYNCFSNRICPEIQLILGKDPITNKAQKIFDSSDHNYKIYMIPVKFFKNYTIAIDSTTPIEMFCGFYDQYLDTDSINNDLMHDTYKKIPASLFKQPFLYTELSQYYKATLKKVETLKATEANLTNNTNSSKSVSKEEKFMRSSGNKEKNLKLFIKIPIQNKSTITILEGDFRQYNQELLANTEDNTENTICKRYTNSTTTNYETLSINAPKVEDRPFTPISNLQLLKMNTGVSHPFADKLIDYLSGNVITPLDENADNIKRVQHVLAQHKIFFDNYGAWNNKIQPIIYDFLLTGLHCSDPSTSPEKSTDILGYIDNTAEINIKGPKSNPKATSISKAFIYPDLYRDLQKEGGLK